MAPWKDQRNAHGSRGMRIGIIYSHAIHGTIRESPSLRVLPLICEALVASEVARPMEILVALLDVLNLTLHGQLEKGETVFLQCTIMSTIDRVAARVAVRGPIRWRVFTNISEASDSWWQPAAN
jgi:hypothetical protein